jgi:NDP-sugar pyrophosphorylase family protein
LKAIILCAGYGKRLYPYTEKYQKTMIPIHGKPLLRYIIDGLVYAGIRDFILVVGYRKEQIINYFQNETKLNITIEYIQQKELNGTGGALLLCENLISNSHFILTWGDILLDYSVYKVINDIFKKEHHDFILTANHTDDPHLGAAVYAQDSYLTDIIEKPAKHSSRSTLNNAGLFILSKEIFKTLKLVKPSQRGEIELPDAVVMGIKIRNWKVRVFEMQKDQFRGDFGNRREYERLKEDKSWLQFLNFK